MASVHDLPFEAGRFGVVFAHALFQHLAEPERAAREMCRFLAPGGIVALRSPDWGADWGADWGGLLLAPRTLPSPRPWRRSWGNIMQKIWEGTGPGWQ